MPKDQPIPRRISFSEQYELVPILIRMRKRTKGRLKDYAMENRQSQASIIEAAVLEYLDERAPERETDVQGRLALLPDHV
jgi:hypothetical protein